MKIVVTDLTRFKNEEKVCIAGLCSQTAICVRPMPYLSRAYAMQSGIQPGSVLIGNFVADNGVKAPHVEDHTRSTIAVSPQVSADEFESLLVRSISSGVRSGFGILPNNRVFEEAPPRSIITIRLDDPLFQLKVGIDQYGKMKADFTDGDGDTFRWVPITDLGFYNYLSALKNGDPQLTELSAFIRQQNRVYLRVGLSRHHVSNGRSGYWMQLNGIYTFPLYNEQLRSYG